MTEPRVDVMLEAHYLIAPILLEEAAFDVIRWARRHLREQIQGHPQHGALVSEIRRRDHILGSVVQIEDTDWGKRVSLLIYDAGSDLDDDFFPYRDPALPPIANRDLGDESDSSGFIN